MVGIYGTKINFNKIWVYQNEGVPSNRAAKIQTFQRLRYTHEIFRIGKYEEKIKFGDANP